MKKGKRRKLKVIIILLPIIFAVPGYFLLFNRTDNPSSKIREARNALSEAKKVNAGKYVGHLYAEALGFYDSAMILWKKENEKLPPFRNFDSVILFAETSREKAAEAYKLAVAGNAHLKKTMEKDISLLEHGIILFENSYSVFPPDQETTKNLESGKLLLAESKILFRKSEYHACGEKLLSAKSRIEKARLLMEKKVIQYFSKLPEWKSLADKTIRTSSGNGSVAIIVDKYARTCTVYKSGKTVKVFPIEMGKNWMNHKKMKGDHATPEGAYKITSKKDGNKTKYYKALLIDYPNENDKQRFKKDKKKGLIPQNADIGSLIEIHGGGGRGEDWTSGCVALTNDNMDELFKLVSVGTPVTIVGALEEFRPEN
ncbi:MAG: L,D-transpeptidase [Bacteroidetes bacterium]|nr:L,D-transpeptidase [Bacteroidota bacterium]